MVIHHQETIHSWIQDKYHKLDHVSLFVILIHHYQIHNINFEIQDKSQYRYNIIIIFLVLLLKLLINQLIIPMSDSIAGCPGPGPITMN